MLLFWRAARDVAYSKELKTFCGKLHENFILINQYFDVEIFDVN